MSCRMLLGGCLAACALSGAVATATASPPAARCTPAGARTAILAEPSLKSLRPTMNNGGGVDRLICRDLTHDGRPDMAAAIFSGGTAGDIAWVVFRRAEGHWLLVLRQLGLYKIGLFTVGSDLVDSQPVYHSQDPNCCPSGGFDHRRFHWDGKRFTIVKRWHDKRFRP